MDYEKKLINDAIKLFEIELETCKIKIKVLKMLVKQLELIEDKK